MELLREKLQARHPDLRAAFRQLDVDSDASLSYNEFESQLQKWLPTLSAAKANDISRLLDANGDGMIDFEEFSKVLSADDDNPKTTRSGLARERDMRSISEMKNGARGRFGATPTASYGVAAREAIMGIPGSAHYASETQRFGATVSHQAVPEFQMLDAAHKARVKQAKALRTAYYTQRSEAISAALQSKKERLAEKRLDSIFDQRLRYNTSVAMENCAKLRH
mmetsp:Transcript_8519/g.22453  ORF Transcript_8519/g.22453 Transcript_8519/m.22453 type:complete len:223 (+) Transcript_8519:145-813(+)